MEPETATLRQQQQELVTLLAQPSDKQARPCPDCRLPCPCCGSKACTCACASDCQHAPRRLSSEPECFPIEAGIVPLVYALSSLRLCPPCWSCEGHNDVEERLHKLPSVWFYSRSLVYPRVIAAYLSNLKIARKLSHGWHVVLVSWGESLETTFAIEPRIDTAEPPGLEALRKDLCTIAAGLHRDIKLLAADLIKEFDRALAQQG